MLWNHAISFFCIVLSVACGWRATYLRVKIFRSNFSVLEILPVFVLSSSFLDLNYCCNNLNDIVGKRYEYFDTNCVYSPLLAGCSVRFYERIIIIYSQVNSLRNSFQKIKRFELWTTNQYICMVCFKRHFELGGIDDSIVSVFPLGHAQNWATRSSKWARLHIFLMGNKSTGQTTKPSYAE